MASESIKKRKRNKGSISKSSSENWATKKWRENQKSVAASGERRKASKSDGGVASRRWRNMASCIGIIKGNNQRHNHQNYRK